MEGVPEFDDARATIAELRAQADELGSALKWPFERAELYRRAAQLAEEHGFEKDAKQSRWDALLFDLRCGGVLTEASERFTPSIRMDDGHQYPDPTEFTGEALAYYADRAHALANPLVRSRYAEYLWMRRQDVSQAHVFGRLAVESYLESVPLHAADDQGLELEDALVSAATVAVELNDRPLLKRVQAAVLEWVERLAADKNTIRFILEVANRLVAMKVHFTADEWNRIAVCVERGAQHFRGEGANELLEEQFHVAHVDLLRRADSDEARILAARLAHAESREHQAMLAAPRSRLVEAHLLLRAIAAYEAVGAKEKVSELHIRLAAATKAGEAEFAPVSANVQLPAGEIDAAVEALCEGAIEVALDRIALHAIPSALVVEKQKQENETLSPVVHLFGRSQLRGGKIVYGGGPAYDHAETLFLECFQMAYRFNLDILVRAALDRLLERGLKVEHVTGRLRRRGWYDDATLLTVEKGVNLYDEGRHLESVYALIPQVEDMLRQAVRFLGGATTAYRRQKGGVDEVTLEHVLENRLIEQHFGRDYVIFARTTLVDSRAENLRNEVGHGLLKTSTEDRLLADLTMIHVVLLGTLQAPIRIGADQSGAQL